MKYPFYKYALNTFLYLTIVIILALNVSCRKVSDPFEDIDIKPEHTGKLKLFILAGQSNMSGRGDLTDYVNTIDSNIYLFGNDYKWHYAQEPTDNEYDQRDKCSIDKLPGVSPALSFAKTVRKFDSTAIIGLIPCATGGSSIIEWQKSSSEKSLYNSLIKRSIIASQYGEICGILFYQGERDANTEYINSSGNKYGLPNSWADYFKKFVHDVRKDLHLHELPIIMAELGTTNKNETYGYWNEIKQQQKVIQINNVFPLITEDLTLEDNLHFTTESYITMGKRFARIYLDFKSTDKDEVIQSDSKKP